MALNTEIFKWLTGIFGEYNSSSVNVETDVRRAYRKLLAIRIPATTILETVAQHPIVRFPANVTLRSAHFAVTTTIASNGTDTVTVLLEKADGAGGAHTTVGSVDNNGTAITDSVPRSISISTSADTVDSGGILSLTINKGGAGQTTSNAVLTVEYEER